MRFDFVVVAITLGHPIVYEEEENLSMPGLENLYDGASVGSVPVTPNQESLKIFEMMSEYVEGLDKLSGVHPAVSVFGSARTKRNHAHYQLARKTSKLISRAGFSIVSGGGPGIMEAANHGAQEGGSPSIGLNIILADNAELPNAYQDISLYFRHFFVRKLMFMHFASAYVVMPGGLGTLDEALECLTLMQTGKTRQIPIILADGGFWKGLMTWLKDALLANGTIDEKDLKLFQVLDHPEEIRDAILDSYG